jgi:hypothetical protein
LFKNPRDDTDEKCRVRANLFPNDDRQSVQVPKQNGLQSFHRLMLAVISSTRGIKLEIITDAHNVARNVVPIELEKQNKLCNSFFNKDTLILFIVINITA